MKAKCCIVFVLVADESIDSAAMLDCISSFFLKCYFLFCFTPCNRIVVFKGKMGRSCEFFQITKIMGKGAGAGLELFW